MAQSPTFHILRELGSGGMGEVFLAEMRLSSGGHLVALKRIRRGLLEQPKALSLFQRECRIGSLLQDEHIVGLRAHGQDKDGPYLAMEYVDGVPASELGRAATVEAPTVPISVALSVARDAARGLFRAHGYVNEALGISGVIHRDVSPENVLVGRDGVAKMADFGIAKVRGATHITETGALKGKFSYMAPELFHGGDADVQTDVFAFAATLFRLLCGVAPFYGRSEADTMRAVLYGQPPRASSLVAGVPDEIDAWIARALEKDRELRPKDLSEICKLLERHHGEKQTAQVREWVERALALPRPVRTNWGEVVATKPISPGALASPKPPQVTASGETEPQRKIDRRAIAGVAVGILIASVALYWGVRKSDSAQARTSAPVVTAAPAPAQPAPLTVEPAPPPAMPVDAPSKPTPERPKPTPATPTKTTGTSPTKVAAVSRARPKTGKLRVKVMPWAEAFVNGSHVGKTPFAPLTLPEGTHSVILVNNELRARKQYQVKVTGGKETVLKVELQGQQ